jgi:hypothetical protein
MRDSDFTRKGNEPPPAIACQIIKRLAPLEYEIAAERAAIGKGNEENLSCWESVSTAVKGFFNPRIKFYYDKQEVKRDFQNDPRLNGLGLITSKAVSADRQGISGAIKYGANKEWLNRVKANPGQFIIGVIQGLACLILLPLAFPSILFQMGGATLRIDRI